MRTEIKIAAIKPSSALSQEQKELLLKTIEREAAFLHKEKIWKSPSIFDFIKSPIFWANVLIELLKFAYERILIKNK